MRPTLSASSADRRFAAPTLPRMEHRDLALPARLANDRDGLVRRLTAEGCENPAERAAELARHGRARFYRGYDDTIIHVTLTTTTRKASR